MNQNILSKKEPLLSVKVFSDFSDVDSALNRLMENTMPDTEVTLLLKFEDIVAKSKRVIEEIKDSLTDIWGLKIPFGFFYNLEIGSVFIAGPLIEVFLFDVDGKKLAALSEGPYGILRGFGVNEDQAASHIKALMQGAYLLLIRQ